MRLVALFALFIPLVLLGQDAERFARALDKRNTRAVDRWMKHEFKTHRKGSEVSTPGSSYITHASTYDDLSDWLKAQPGLMDATWDRCVIKLSSWPGHSTFGVVIRMGDRIEERCYVLQEGRLGTTDIFGWKLRVRSAQEELKVQGVRNCPGFVQEQRAACEELKR